MSGARPANGRQTAWPLLLLDAAGARRAMGEDVRRGLTSNPMTLPPKYFYDAAGSALFDQITRLPEYYCTRAEQEVLDSWAEGLMAAVRPREVVELGSGSMAKADMLLSTAAGREVQTYVPFDVDPSIIRTAAEAFANHRPALAVHGVVGDFERHLGVLPAPDGRRLVVFFGSTIGNLDPGPRLELLRTVHKLIRPDGSFLLGVDLVKDVRTLELAYNDPAGVTAAFNRNILRAINNALGADFKPEAFRHHSFYNAGASRIEMHLITEVHQRVRVPAIGLDLDLPAGADIWTENSYKFTRDSTVAILAEAGLGLVDWRTDAASRFALALAAAA